MLAVSRHVAVAVVVAVEGFLSASSLPPASFSSALLLLSVS